MDIRSLNIILKLSIYIHFDANIDTDIDTYIDTYIDTDIDTDIDTYIDTDIDTRMHSSRYSYYYYSLIFLKGLINSKLSQEYTTHTNTQEEYTYTRIHKNTNIQEYTYTTSK